MLVDKKALGQEIEQLELLVEDEDYDKYLEIIEKYTKRFADDLTIAECVERMEYYECMQLYDELLKLHYKVEY